MTIKIEHIATVAAVMIAALASQEVLAGPHPPSAVPVPAAIWMVGSALAGLVGVARRKKRDAEENKHSDGTHDDKR